MAIFFPSRISEIFLKFSYIIFTPYFCIDLIFERFLFSLKKFLRFSEISGPIPLILLKSSKLAEIKSSKVLKFSEIILADVSPTSLILREFIKFLNFMFFFSSISLIILFADFKPRPSKASICSALRLNISEVNLIKLLL